MKMDVKMAEALSAQLVYELYSAYLYLALAAEMESIKFPGAAHWLRIQADEEMFHADLFYTHLNNRSAKITFGEIKKPEFKVSSAREAFEMALGHEYTVTKRIHALMAQAMALNDFPTVNFLQFFVGEQVQEERAAEQVIDRLKMAGTNSEALLFVDADLTTRPAATAPTGVTV